MTILKEHVKTLDIPTIFTRKGNDSHNRDTFVYLKTTVHLKIWEIKKYENENLSLMIGHGQQLEDDKKRTYFTKVLRVIWHHTVENCEEIEDFHYRAYDGLDITVDEDETVIPEKEALELIREAKVKFLDENLAKRWFIFK